MPHLKENPTLKDFQEYVKNLEEERGFAKNPLLQNMLMLGEEMGELFKAVRKYEKMRIDSKSDVGNIEEELADIIIYLCSIANRTGVDLEKAFRSKEEINKIRSWK